MGSTSICYFSATALNLSAMTIIDCKVLSKPYFILLSFSAMMNFNNTTCTLEQKHSYIILVPWSNEPIREGISHQAVQDEYKLLVWSAVWLFVHKFVNFNLVSALVSRWFQADGYRLDSCFLTDAPVKNVFSVAFRSVMMTYSYFWEIICIYFCTAKI